MSHSLSDLLLRYAQQFEDQHAPQNMTIALREAAKEIERLRAGGCARDQSTTQYCAEAARLVEENEQNRIDLEEYRRDVERLRAALLPFACDCPVHERCAEPDYCVNFQARRAALKEEKTDD
jgi:hypothetical protein